MQRSIIFAAATVVAAATGAYAVPPAANSASAQAADPRSRIVCRSHTETGSLARTIRTCKTRREWDADTANLRETGGGAASCRGAGEGGQC
jgi:hypothetical protein